MAVFTNQSGPGLKCSLWTLVFNILFFTSFVDEITVHICYVRCKGQTWTRHVNHFPGRYTSRPWLSQATAWQFSFPKNQTITLKPRLNRLLSKDILGKHMHQFRGQTVSHAQRRMSEFFFWRKVLQRHLHKRLTVLLFSGFLPPLFYTSRMVNDWHQSLLHLDWPLSGQSRDLMVHLSLNLNRLCQ